MLHNVTYEIILDRCDFIEPLLDLAMHNTPPIENVENIE